MEMTSSRPYLIRALHEWMTDNGLTPHLLIDTAADGVQVPQQYVKDGKIVLNVSPGAVHALSLGNDVIEFSARFAGTPMNVVVPVNAVLAIYSRENGQGMMFTEEGEGGEPPPSAPDPSPQGKAKKPVLKVVK